MASENGQLQKRRQLQVNWEPVPQWQSPQGIDLLELLKNGLLPWRVPLPIDLPAPLLQTDLAD